MPASTSTRLEAAARAAAPQCRQQQPNYVSYARRATKAIETILYCLVQFENATFEGNHFQSINQSVILDNCFLNRTPLETKV